MICKYVSGSGDEFILNDSYEVNISSGNPYSTKWTIEGNTLNYGVLPTQVKKDALNIEITLKFRGSINEMKQNMETFFRMCERDILAFNNDKKTMGTLYIGNEYLKGFVIERATEPAQEYYGFSQTFLFSAPHPFWIHEETNEFYAGSETTNGNNLDYPYDYPYDYAADTRGVKAWAIDHYADSEFKMTIYGAVRNPRILVDGYPYEIYAELLDREYLVIDSREKTVVKVDALGRETNIFNYRAKGNSVFRKMPSGNVLFNWNGNFGFTVTLFIERSEPRWR